MQQSLDSLLTKHIKNRNSISGPFTFILFLTALKELFEDIKRKNADRRVNSAKTLVYDPNTNSFKENKWQNIEVGDIIKVEDGKFFPADLVLLATSEPQGLSYIETSNLDGETNLKIRTAVPNTDRLIRPDSNAPPNNSNEGIDLSHVQGELQYEKPNR